MSQHCPQNQSRSLTNTHSQTLTHLIRLLPLPILENWPNLTLLRQNPHPLTLQILHQPRMIHLQSLGGLTAPRQSARTPITLWRLRLLDRARERREAEGAEFEHVGFMQEGAAR